MAACKGTPISVRIMSDVLALVCRRYCLVSRVRNCESQSEVAFCEVLGRPAGAFRGHRDYDCCADKSIDRLVSSSSGDSIHNL